MKEFAILGPGEHFCDEAFKKYKKKSKDDCRVVYRESIDYIFNDLGTNLDGAVIPIENSKEGFFQYTLDKLLMGEFQMTEEIFVPIRFSLEANVEKLNEIQKIYAPHPLKCFCQDYMAGLCDGQVVITENVLYAHKQVENGNTGDAAIIPTSMLKNSGARLKIKDISDSQNTMRYAVILPKGKSTITTRLDSFKITFYIITESDEPGLLCRILQTFAEASINLVTILSLPAKKSSKPYSFFLELKGTQTELENILDTLHLIERSYLIKILGIY